MQLPQKLQQLKNTPEGGKPRAEFVLKNREFVLATISRQTPVSVGSLALFMETLRASFSPRLAYSLGAIALLLSSVATATVTRNALPGGAFYGAKLAVEATQVRLVSNPAERAKVQMGLAGNRLRELEKVAGGAETNGQTTEVLKHFSKDVQRAQAALRQAADPAQVKSAKQELVKKAREYEQKLQEVEVRVRPQREVGMAGIDEAAQALKAVQEEEAAEDAMEELMPVEDEPVKNQALKDGEVGL